MSAADDITGAERDLAVLEQVAQRSRTPSYETLVEALAVMNGMFDYLAERLGVADQPKDSEVLADAIDKLKRKAANALMDFSLISSRLDTVGKYLGVDSEALVEDPSIVEIRLREVMADAAERVAARERLLPIAQPYRRQAILAIIDEVRGGS